MKRTIIPYKQYLVLSILDFFMTLFMISEWPRFMCDTVSFIFDAFRAHSRFNVFMSITSALVVLFVYAPCCLFFLFCVIYLFLLSGRTIKFSEDVIIQGFIKKDVYRKEDITGIGIAPLASELPKEQAFCNALGIYVAFGDYKEEDMKKYGIWNVYQQVELSKKMPRAIKRLNKISSSKTFQKLAPGVSDASGVHVFDGMLWMTYTEENFRFLKNWLGSKYYEILQQ